MKLAIILIILTIAIGDHGPANAGTRYRLIEVVTFREAEGLALPARFQVTLTADVLEHLGKLPVQAVSEGQRRDSDGPALRLTGTVTQFKAGSRSLRYLTGPVMGATKVAAHIVVTDRGTGETLAEFDADGKVFMGPFGGDSMGASNGLAKEVAKKIKRRFF
jgi:hypothetical protein